MKKQREIKETIPFTTATKRIKYLRINLPKETKGFLSGSAGKEFACNMGHLNLIPGLGRSPGEGGQRRQKYTMYKRQSL